MRGALLIALFSIAVACGGSSKRSSGDDSGSDAGSGAEGGSSGATGGASGSATGGSSGNGGTAGTGGTTVVEPGLCTRDEDCTLSTDCCSCFAAGPGEATSLCRRACTPTTTACAREGTTEVACIAGRCTLARSCDLRFVTCEIVEPECPAGTIPSAIDTCYGPCTVVSECLIVPSCDTCESAGLACVTSLGADGEYYSCASIPASCESNPTCECMQVCHDIFTCRDPASTDLTCDCYSC